MFSWAHGHPDKKCISLSPLKIWWCEVEPYSLNGGGHSTPSLCPFKNLFVILLCPLPSPDGWNEDTMEGAAAAILGHEQKITVGEDRITGSFVKGGCPTSSDFSLSEE